MRRLVGLLCLTAVGISGCEDKTEQLHKEVEGLRAEVRELKQLQYQVASLESDVTRLSENATSPSTKTSEAQTEQPIFPAQLNEGRSAADDPFLGEKAAPVVIMAFSDYHCKTCRKFFLETLPVLKRSYIELGKVKFVYRDFPLRTDSNSIEPAEIANCAGEQGQYWFIHSALLEHSDPLQDTDLDSILRTITNLDRPRFQKCLMSNKYADEIQKDTDDAQKLGMKGVPSFFVAKANPDGSLDGVVIRGAQPLPVFQSQIDEILKPKLQAH